MRHPLRISFDLDGVVLMDQGPEFIGFLKKDCGLVFDGTEFAKSHSWTKALGLEVAEINTLFSRFAAVCPPPTFAPGAREGLSYISTFAHVHINTARHGRALEVAMSVLVEAGIGWRGAHGGMSRRKHLALVEHSIPWHVEDSIEDVYCIITECDHAEVVQFPSYAPGTVPEAVLHERVRVLQPLHNVENYSREAILEQCWAETVEHFESVCAARA